MSLAGPSNRKRKASDASRDPRVKRSRAEDVDPSGSRWGVEPVVGPYNTLPRATSKYVRLRFTLAKLRGVYRVVTVPLTFTFANLHKLLLFLFGWSGRHAHIFHVYAHAHIYAPSYRAGVLNMKRTGRPPPVPEGYPYSKEVWEAANANKPEWAAVPMGKAEQKQKQKGKEGGKEKEKGERVREEDTVTLGEVWNRRRERNASGGACENGEIAVVWTYDFAAEWEVHITCEGAQPLVTVTEASNLPDITSTKGAAVMEDEPTVEGHTPPHLKNVPYHLYMTNSFPRFCKGEIVSVAHREGQLVMEREKWEERIKREREARGEGEDANEEDGEGIGTDGEEEEGQGEGDVGEEEEGQHVGGGDVGDEVVGEEGLQDDGEGEVGDGEAGVTEGQDGEEESGAGEMQDAVMALFDQVQAMAGEDDMDWDEVDDEEEAAVVAAATAAVAVIMATVALVRSRRRQHY